jgi:hypothetical protein
MATGDGASGGRRRRGNLAVGTPASRAADSADGLFHPDAAALHPLGERIDAGASGFRIRLRRAASRCAEALLLLAWAAHAPAREPAEPRADLATLDGLVGRWMALRTTIAEERRQWEDRRGQWENEIDLLEREAEALQREIDEGGDFVSAFERERAEWRPRKESLERERKQLRGALDRAEADLRAWRPAIPDGLRPPLASAFAALPETQAEADRKDLSERARTVAALYTRIETLQNEFHAASETLATERGRRRVDVLYAGLARGFAVSPGGDWAAVGEPAADGWTWTPTPEAAATIREAIEILNRERTVRYVELPMNIAGEARP